MILSHLHHDPLRFADIPEIAERAGSLQIMEKNRPLRVADLFQHFY